MYEYVIFLLNYVRELYKIEGQILFARRLIVELNIYRF